MCRLQAVSSAKKNRTKTIFLIFPSLMHLWKKYLSSKLIKQLGEICSRGHRRQLMLCVKVLFPTLFESLRKHWGVQRRAMHLVE